NSQLDQALVILIANDINSFDKSLISRCSGVCFSNQNNETQVFEFLKKQIDSSEHRDSEDAQKTLTAVKAMLDIT
ncbi:hypothetical protein CGI93_23790, partial [Vibrio parahaemolyticus]|uniref:hypothetical protein n=1 Tax=Vibrio parahaemolyticus TaxID=670 RepID=UPI0011678C91